jgi:hypothetical protein
MVYALKTSVVTNDLLCLLPTISIIVCVPFKPLFETNDHCRVRSSSPQTNDYFLCLLEASSAASGRTTGVVLGRYVQICGQGMGCASLTNTVLC